MKILYVSALPQEYAPLKDFFPSWHPIQKSPIKKIQITLPDKEVLLVESGMGVDAVRKMLTDVLPCFSPDLMLFAGFAGGLHQALGVGTVCFVESIETIPSGFGFRLHFPDLFREFLKEHGVCPVTAYSVQKPENKSAVAELSEGKYAIMDMETSIVADVALLEKIPMVCFRGISDAIDDELGFDLGQISTCDGRIDIRRVMRLALQEFAVIKAFYLSWIRSRTAARRLCQTMARFLSLPSVRVQEILNGIRLERSSQDHKL